MSLFGLKYYLNIFHTIILMISNPEAFLGRKDISSFRTNFQVRWTFPRLLPGFSIEVCISFCSLPVLLGVKMSTEYFCHLLDVKIIYKFIGFS